MPATVAKRDGKYRVVESEDGSLVTNDKGTAVDGGGHESRSDAVAQARAINASKDDLSKYPNTLEEDILEAKVMVLMNLKADNETQQKASDALQDLVDAWDAVDGGDPNADA